MEQTLLSFSDFISLIGILISLAALIVAIFSQKIVDILFPPKINIAIKNSHGEYQVEPLYDEYTDSFNNTYSYISGYKYYLNYYLKLYNSNYINSINNCQLYFIELANKPKNDLSAKWSTSNFNVPISITFLPDFITTISVLKHYRIFKICKLENSDTYTHFDSDYLKWILFDKIILDKNMIYRIKLEVHGDNYVQVDRACLLFELEFIDLEPDLDIEFKNLSKNIKIKRVVE